MVLVVGVLFALSGYHWGSTLRTKDVLFANASGKLTCSVSELEWSEVWLAWCDENVGEFETRAKAREAVEREIAQQVAGKPKAKKAQPYFRSQPEIKTSPASR